MEKNIIVYNLPKNIQTTAKIILKTLFEAGKEKDISEYYEEVKGIDLKSLVNIPKLISSQLLKQILSIK